MRPARAITILSTCLLMLAILSACGSSNKPYKTVVKKPDTEKAMRLNARAAELIDEGKLDEAEKALREALAADVTFGPAHNNLGLVYYQQDKLYQAAWEFQYAIRLMPYFPEPKNNLGLVFERIGKLDDAVEHFAQARKLEPDNPQFIGNLARAQVRRGDRGQETKDLLSELVFKDTRPEWRDWAQENLMRMDVVRQVPPASPTTQATTSPG